MSSNYPDENGTCPPQAMCDRIQERLSTCEEILAQIPGQDALRSLSDLEVSGVGALLAGLHGNIESILSQLARYRSLVIPAGAHGKRSLLEMSFENGIVEAATADGLKPFFALHETMCRTGGLGLNTDDLADLAGKAPDVLALLRADVESFLQE